MFKIVLVLFVLLVSLPAEVITIKSEDGFKLFGELTLPTKLAKSKIVLLAHQFGSDKESWGSLVGKLHENGYSTLAIDIRGHGQSTQKSGEEIEFQPNLSTPEHIKESLIQLDKLVNLSLVKNDISLWINQLDLLGFETQNLVAIGSSLGSNSIIKSLEDVEYRAIVLLSVGRVEDAQTLFGISSTKTLFITALDDAMGSTQHSLKYLPYCINGKLFVINGDKHGTANLNTIEHDIIDFIR